MQDEFVNQEVINYLCKKLWIEENKKRIAELKIDLCKMIRNLKDADISHQNLNKEIKYDCDVRIDLLNTLLKELKRLKFE